MKGQAAVVIIVLVVIAVAAFIIIPQLGINFPTSGGIPVQTVKYSNNIISIEDFSISDSSPLSGSKITILFSVTNNGDRDLDESNKLRVSFTDLPNIEKISDNDLIRLQCPEDSKKSPDGLSCEIKKLVSLDSKRIQAELKVKSNIKDQIQSSTIKYHVSYKITGAVEARIPIVEDPIFLPKDAKFQVSTPTYGPIQVSLKPPVGRERKVGNQVIVDNFAYKDSPFTLDISVRDVGSFPKEDVKFGPDEEFFKINLDSLEIILCSRTDAISGNKVAYLITNPEQKVPFEMSCNLKPTSKESYTIGTVNINYKYDYKLLGSQTISIRPLP